jgi:hypothetical protein
MSWRALFCRHCKDTATHIKQPAFDWGSSRHATGVCCSVLQCVAAQTYIYTSALRWGSSRQLTGVCCSVLHCVAVQCVAAQTYTHLHFDEVIPDMPRARHTIVYSSAKEPHISAKELYCKSAKELYSISAKEPHISRLQFVEVEVGMPRACVAACVCVLQCVAAQTHTHTLALHWGSSRHAMGDKHPSISNRKRALYIRKRARCIAAKEPTQHTCISLR